MLFTASVRNVVIVKIHEFSVKWLSELKAKTVKNPIYYKCSLAAKCFGAT
jgi:hypothetical protein